MGIMRANCRGIVLLKMDFSRKKLIVIVGPTAVGKTAVAIQLAKHFHTAVVSADSRQIFREMTIGTAKPSKEEMEGVPHFMIDTHSIQDHYNAARFAEDAMAIILKLFEKSDYVIVCGGSGLYVRALLEGFDDIPEVPDKIRGSITAKFHERGLPWLQEKVHQHDPDFYEQVDIQNPARLMRALEVFEATGMPFSAFRKKNKKTHPFQIIKIGLDMDRDELYKRIDGRMDAMISSGLFDEAKQLFPHRHLQALQTVGYQEIFDYLERKYDYAEAVRLLKRNSRRYAKRQLTWFRRDEEIKWYKPDEMKQLINNI